MPEPVAVAVLGVGHIGSVHLESARAMAATTVRAVADREAANRERARERCDCATYADYESLLDAEDVDVAVVALPPFLHADAAVAAAEHGCHVFVEKPLARSSEEARRILDVADREEVAVGADHTLRYMPAMQELKRRYDDGEFGHVPLCRATRVNDGPLGSPPNGERPADWHLDPDATGGGALADLGIHLFDALRWFFGDLEVEHATLGRQLDLPYEDTATVVVDAESGTTATVNCGFFQREDPDDSYPAAVAACERLLTEAARERAVMTVLWHPRLFSEAEFPGYRRLYRHLVERALEMGAWVGAPRDYLAERPLGPLGGSADDPN